MKVREALKIIMKSIFEYHSFYGLGQFKNYRVVMLLLRVFIKVYNISIYKQIIIYKIININVKFTQE